jgi:sulfur carrier protein ThiS
LQGSSKALGDRTLKIEVHLHTILQRKTPAGLISRLDVDLQEGSAVSVLLEHLEINLNPDALLIAVNGRVAETDRILVDKDVVNLMPAISGGQGVANNNYLSLHKCKNKLCSLNCAGGARTIQIT